MPYVEIIEVQRCRANGGTFVEHRGHELAIFRTDESSEVIVLDNTCPHSGGNLSAGAVADGLVTCPLHDWRFDLKTGVCVQSELARVNRYPAEIRDGAVWVDLPD